MVAKTLFILFLLHMCGQHYWSSYTKQKIQSATVTWQCHRLNVVYLTIKCTDQRRWVTGSVSLKMQLFNAGRQWINTINVWSLFIRSFWIDKPCKSTLRSVADLVHIDASLHAAFPCLTWSSQTARSATAGFVQAKTRSKTPFQDSTNTNTIHFIKLFGV